MSIERYPSLSHWGAFTAEVTNGKLVKCTPFHGDPFPSEILRSMPEMIHSPLRIARPAIRENWLNERRVGSARQDRGSGRFIEVDWDTALSLASSELDRIRTRYGSTAIFGGSYGWSSAGRLHHARTLTHRFLNSSGGCVHQSGNYSWGAAQFILPHVIGTYYPVTGRVTDWRSIERHTELFIAFGGLPERNLQITSGGGAIHGSSDWLRRLKNSSIELVCISPNKNDLPKGLSARWIPIRPNTDVALMLGMAHTLLVDDLYDEEFVRSRCIGFDKFTEYLNGSVDGEPKSAEWASRICGVNAEVIASLASLAAARRTMINCTWSLQRGHRGEQPYWASIALASLLGQIGLPGGGFAFGFGSINGVGSPRPGVAAPGMSGGQDSVGRPIPVAKLADMLLQPGSPFEFNGKVHEYPDIKLVYWAGGNPFHHHQDLNKLSKAWQKPDTIIVHESWWTPTARRADIVFPATTTLERNDIGGSSRDRFVIAMKKALPNHEQSRNDFDIFRELSSRAGCEASFTEGRGEMEWVRHIYEEMACDWSLAGFKVPCFDDFWRAEYVELPEPQDHYVMFEDFRCDPLRYPLSTPSGKIELYSETIASFKYEDCPPVPTWMPPIEWLGAAEARSWPLHLVTTQPRMKLHSQFDAAHVSREAKVNSRERILINPTDAATRDILSGDIVTVRNARGKCLAGAEIDKGVMKGVVVMSTGAWFDPGPGGMDRHGNPNILTVDVGTSRLAQGPSALSVLVEIEKWTGPTPNVHAFELPEIIRSDPLRNGSEP
jgi:biotin/methionine sulfoxide reductase